MLSDWDFLETERKTTMYFEYSRKINWIDYNLDFNFIYIDLKNVLQKQYKSYIIWLFELNNYLSDISELYDYAKDKLAKLSQDDLLNERFSYWGYYLKNTEKQKIKLFNDKWECFYNIIVNNNILPSSELVDVIWSRSKLWWENAIYEYEDKIIFY